MNMDMRVAPLALTLSLEDDSILVGRDVLEVLGYPKQLQLMFNDTQKKILLQACTIDDKGAVVVPPQPMLYFAVSGHSLLKRIRKITGWQDNDPRTLEGFQVPGRLAIVFDLQTAYVPVFSREPVVEYPQNSDMEFE